jgi:Na+-driven multidrug efflux pump
MFSLSNIFLTGALNSLKHTYLLTARAIALNLSSLANNISSSYMNALVTFSGQNYGAKKYPRLKRCLLIGIVQSCIITIFICSLSILFVKPISMLYVSDSDPQKLLILDAVRLVTITILPPYFIASIMNVLSGLLRGMGYSVTPMLSSIVGVCLLRIVWIYTAFTHVEKLHTIWGLYLCFPITWTVTCVFLSIILFVAWKRLKKQQTLTLSNL